MPHFFFFFRCVLVFVSRVHTHLCTLLFGKMSVQDFSNIIKYPLTFTEPFEMSLNYSKYNGFLELRAFIFHRNTRKITKSFMHKHLVQITWSKMYFHIKFHNWNTINNSSIIVVISFIVSMSRCIITILIARVRWAFAVFFSSFFNRFYIAKFLRVRHEFPIFFSYTVYNFSCHSNNSRCYNQGAVP